MDRLFLRAPARSLPSRYLDWVFAHGDLLVARDHKSGNDKQLRGFASPNAARPQRSIAMGTFGLYRSSSAVQGPGLGEDGLPAGAG